MGNLKQHKGLKAVNEPLWQQIEPEPVQVEIVQVGLLAESTGIESELDEMWSFVQKQANQRWLGWAIDHNSRRVLAYAFGNPGDAVFKKLQALLEPLELGSFIPMAGEPMNEV